MKKRKKTRVKRLTKNEVLLVAEMQSKIDYYERFIHELSAMCWTKKVQFILEDRYSDDESGVIYRFVRKKIEEENDAKENELITIDQAVDSFGESCPTFRQLMGRFERYLRNKYGKQP